MRPDETRMLPSNAEAEKALLGSMIMDPETVLLVGEIVTPDDFYIVKNGWIFQALLDLEQRRVNIDFVTLCDDLENKQQMDGVGGAAYVSSLINAVPTAVHVYNYARIVAGTAKRRQLISVAAQIATFAWDEAMGLDDVLGGAEAAVYAVSQTSSDSGQTEPIREVLARYYDELFARYEAGGGLAGVPTGFPDLDCILNGLKKGDLIYLAGRPSIGKTSLCVDIATFAATAGFRVLFFSLEMANEQLIERMLSTDTEIASQNLQSGSIGDYDMSKIVDSSGKLARFPLWLCDTAMQTPAKLRSEIRRRMSEIGKVDLVVVDYLQLMDSDTKSRDRVERFSDISHGLKRASQELRIPLLVASQLSRACEFRVDKRPLLSDLRETGTLEQDADVVLFVYRDEYYYPDTPMAGIAEIRVAKHRKGPTGMVQLAFKKELAHFETLDAVTKTLVL